MEVESCCISHLPPDEILKLFKSVKRKLQSDDFGKPWSVEYQTELKSYVVLMRILYRRKNEFSTLPVIFWSELSCMTNELGLEVIQRIISTFDGAEMSSITIGNGFIDLSVQLMSSFCRCEDVRLFVTHIMSLIEDSVQPLNHQLPIPCYFMKTLFACSLGDLEIKKCLYRWLNKTIQSDSMPAKVYIILEILPGLADQKNCEEMVSNILRNQNVDLSDEEELSNYLVVLCSICEHVFDSSDPNHSHDTSKIFAEDTVGRIIQRGSFSDNPITRKRSMFVLKKLLENLDEIMSYSSSGILLGDNGNVLNDLIVLMEVLEEKQVHILKPVLCKLDTISEVVMFSKDSHLHHSWLFSVYQRLMQHENKFILKWTISKILTLKLQSCNETFLEALFDFTCKSFLSFLNDSSLYSRKDDPETGFEILENLPAFVKNLFASVSKPGLKFGELVASMCQLSWGGVQLFYLSHAIAQLNPQLWICRNILRNLRQLIVGALQTQEPILRGAIQCQILDVALKMINPSEVSYLELSEFLLVLKKVECFERGKAQWKLTTSAIERWTQDSNDHLLDYQHAIDFCQESFNRLYETVDEDFNNCITDLSYQRIARMLHLFADSFEGRANIKDLFRNIVEETLNTIMSAPQRLYMPKMKLHKALGIFQSIGMRYDSSIAKILLTPFKEMAPDDLSSIFGYLSQLALQSTSAEELYLYFSVLRDVHDSSTELQTELFSKVFPSYKESILSAQVEVPKLFCTWKCLKIFSLKTVTAGLDLMQDIIRGNQLTQLINIPKTFCKHPEEKKMAANALNDAWECVCSVVGLLETNEKDIKSLVELATETMAVASEALIPAMKVLSQLIHRVVDVSLLESCLKVCWQSCLELRKNELFRPAQKLFITVAFNQRLIEQDQVIFNKYYALLKEMGEGSSVIYLLLLDELVRRWTSCMTEESVCTIKPFLFVVSDALMFGNVLRKDQKTLADTCNFIGSFGDYLSVNSLINRDHLADIEIRACGCLFLLCLSNHKVDHRLMADIVGADLLREDRNISQSRPRHFTNSTVHRIKNRIWQAFLVLQDVLSMDFHKEVLKTIYDTISEESQQASVRYLQEWFLTRSLTLKVQTLDDLFQAMGQASLKRVSCVGSFLAVLVHASHHFNVYQEAELESCLRHTLPWCMTQNFTTRVYAHVAFQKLYQNAKKLKFEKTVQQFEVIESSLNNSDKGNANKNVKQILDDFYFQVFDPIAHYSLMTIFYELPRLTKLSDEEWIKPEMMKELFGSVSRIPIMSQNDVLSELEPGAWVPKASWAVNADAGKMSNISDFQKKITPWKEMIPDSLYNLDSFNKKTSKPGGLVVVATLIDKPTNLGGLCRTCEVFGVSEFIIGNLRYTEDQQFKNLSVTAHQWISIKEVKLEHLRGYLSLMKSNGYTLIGAEQTGKSTCLTNYKFPKKSLLFLGNEKEGIPVELIQLLDVCVEIPQIGIVRSLNVHVSGAIFIWEYARQQRE